VRTRSQVHASSMTQAATAERWTFVGLSLDFRWTFVEESLNASWSREPFVCIRVGTICRKSPGPIGTKVRLDLC